MKKYFFFFVFLYHLSISGTTADLIIFSYNRPLQLYALLESIEKYVKGLQKIQAIFLSSNAHYHAAYKQVQKDFPQVVFHAQGNNPHQDFKPLTMQAIERCSSAYLLFAVDDNLVKDYISIPECIAALEQTKAYGFYLRLGKNTYGPYGSISYDYLPEFTHINKQIVRWEFNKSIHYWAYPNSVDMVILRKKDIKSHLSTFLFGTPNQLESSWTGKEATNPYGLCFVFSKIINIPLNRIQTDFPFTPTMDFATPEKLLHIFNEDKKIDISIFHQINNKAPYVHQDPIFIERIIKKFFPKTTLRLAKLPLS